MQNKITLTVSSYYFVTIKKYGYFAFICIKNKNLYNIIKNKILHINNENLSTTWENGIKYFKNIDEELNHDIYSYKTNMSELFCIKEDNIKIATKIKMLLT